MKTVTCNTLVWVRDVAFERGTTFKIVERPEGPKEIDQTLADAWQRNGWVAKPDGKAATEGA